MALQLLEEFGIALLGPGLLSFFHWTEADWLIEVSFALSIFIVIVLVTLIGHSYLYVFRRCFFFSINCADAKVLWRPSCILR